MHRAATHRRTHHEPKPKPCESARGDWIHRPVHAQATTCEDKRRAVPRIFASREPPPPRPPGKHEEDIRMVSAEKNPLTSSRLPAARGKVKKDNRGDKYLECMLAALKAVANGCDNPEDLFAELDANGHDTSQLGKNAQVKRTPAHVRGKLSEATLAWLSQNGQDLVAIDKIDRDACNAAAKDAKDKDNKSVLADVRLFLHHHELEILSEDEEDELIMTKSRAHTQQRTQRRKDAQKEHFVRKVKVKVTMLERCGKDVNAADFNKRLLIEGCEHGRVRSTCKECGGSQICEHGRKRPMCKECGGASICEHGRVRSHCLDCGGSNFCEHGRQRSYCKECGGSQICEHDRVRSTCKECGGSQICAHGRQPSRCKECGGSGLCEHGRVRSQCKECGGSGICEHGRRRYQCKECRAAN